MPEYLINIVLTVEEKLALESFSNSKFLLPAEINLLKKLLSAATKVNGVGENIYDTKGKN